MESSTVQAADSEFTVEAVERVSLSEIIAWAFDHFTLCIRFELLKSLKVVGH